MTDQNEKFTAGTVLGGRYELIAKIGEGGMSEVFRARDNRLDRDVAVKILREELMRDEEFTRRFAGESHAVAMLSHPNIVSVFDVSQNDELEYIIMEMIEGITLRQYMNKKGALPWKEMLHFSKQIASAMAHAHKRGIIHRDIKPQNIMLLKDGTIKVADFGIAALENELKQGEIQAIGSLSYISPEQVRGQSVDARSDIYSFGVVMYEMLSGQKPYSGDTPAEILVDQLNGNLKHLVDITQDVPKELCEIAEKAMSVEPDDRYSSSDELLEDLEQFTADFLAAENAQPEAPEESEEEKLEKNKAFEFLKNFRRRRRVGFGIGTFCLILTLVLVFAFLWNFWIKDIFSPAVRIELPNFVGTSYDELSSNPELRSKYNFNVDYIINTNYPGGTVISQKPDAGRSLMINQKGIDVDLKVSTGFIETEVPDVTDLDFREAVLRLQNSGFQVETHTITSDTVEKNLVISTNPAAGEQLTAGSTVYVDVSGGVEIAYVKMPNLIGLSEEAAIAKIGQYGLTYAGSEKKESDFDAGTVIAQNKVAHAEVEEHQNIIITVSTGPSASPVPELPEPDPYEIIQ